MSVVEQTTSTSKSPRRIPSTVRLGAEVVNDLRTQLGGEEAGAGNGQDAAGLLFGIAERDVLSVKALKALPVRDSAGNGLPECLEAAFERSVATAQTDPDLVSLHLVGWYRIRCPDEIAPFSDTDIEFHNRRFRRATDVALILKPKQHVGAATDSIELYGRSFLKTAISREDYRTGSLPLASTAPVNATSDVAMQETVDDDSHLRVFQVLNSLDKAERGEVWKRIALRFKTITPLSLRPKWMRTATAAALDRTGHRVNPPHVTARSGQTKLWVSSAVLLFAATGVSLAWLYGRSLLSALPVNALFQRAPASTALNMRVEPQAGGALLVKWDARSVAVQSAKNGTVQINDGSEHHDLHLDSHQIANGSILYTPVSRDLTFQLEVFKDNGTAISESMRVVNGSETKLAAHALPNAVASTPVRRSSGSKEKPSFRPPSARLPAVASRVAPAPTSRIPEPERKRPAQPAAMNNSIPTGYVPPRPLKQVMPSAINLTSPLSSGANDVDVAVRIDDEGRVIEARVLNSTSNTNEIFMSAALAAAKEWIFEPAKMYGRNVSSNHTIKFRFH